MLQEFDIAKDYILSFPEEGKKVKPYLLDRMMEMVVSFIHIHIHTHTHTHIHTYTHTYTHAHTMCIVVGGPHW